MGIKERPIAPRSPWRNPYVERLIGSIRREYLDHVIVRDEEHLRRILSRYFAYYHVNRPHSRLEGDSPEKREVETRQPSSCLLILIGVPSRQNSRALLPSNLAGYSARPTVSNGCNGWDEWPPCTGGMVVSF